MKRRIQTCLGKLHCLVNSIAAVSARSSVSTVAGQLENCISSFGILFSQLSPYCTLRFRKLKAGVTEQPRRLQPLIESADAKFQTMCHHDHVKQTFASTDVITHNCLSRVSRNIFDQIKMLSDRPCESETFRPRPK